MKPTAVAPMKVSEKGPPPEVEVVTIPMVNAPAVPHKVVEDKPKWSWCHLVCSLIATLFAGVPGSSCGLIGLVHSVLSYVDHRSTDYRRSTRKRRCAWGWTITAFVFALLFWGMAIYLWVVHNPGAGKWHHEPERMKSEFGKHEKMGGSAFDLIPNEKPSQDDWKPTVKPSPDWKPTDKPSPDWKPTDKPSPDWKPATNKHPGLLGGDGHDSDHHGRRMNGPGPDGGPKRSRREVHGLVYGRPSEVH